MPRSSLEPVAVFACAILAGSCVLAGEWSGELSVRGNSRFGTGEIAAVARRVACGDPDSLCVQAVCRAVAEAYWAQGYLDAEIKCERAGAGGDTIRIEVVEGDPSDLARVRVEGADPEDVPALEAILAAGDLPLSRSAIEAGIDRVLAFYDTRGRPLASVRPEVRRLDSSRLEMVLSVSPGPRAALGSVVLRGLKRINAPAVLPETGLHAGEPYDGAEVDRARERLLALRVFESVSEPGLTFGSEDTTISVVFDLTEARTGFLEGALAYSPTARGSRLAGSLNLEMLSIGGGLRRARVLWRRSGDDRLVWSLYYRERRLAGRPFALEATLASDVVDTSYARRRLMLGLVYVGQPRLEVGVGGSVGSTRDRALAGGEGDFAERGLTFRLRHEGRNRPVNPESGFFFEVTEEVEALRYGEAPSLDRTLSAVEARAQCLLGLTSRTKLAPGGFFTGVFSSSGVVPVSHLARLGGGGSLRGYPEEWFAARRALAVTCEVRRLLGPDSRVYAFFDAATLEAGGHSFGDLDDAPFGYGFGFVGGTAAGLVRVEIALGRGDGWSQAKLHLAVAEQF